MPNFSVKGFQISDAHAYCQIKQQEKTTLPFFLSTKRMCSFWNVIWENTTKQGIHILLNCTKKKKMDCLLFLYFCPFTSPGESHWALKSDKL